jgi:hypothetical protein
MSITYNESALVRILKEVINTLPFVRNGHVGRPDAAPELGHVEWRARTSLIAGLCPATPLSYINSLTCPSSSRARE